MKTIKLLAAAAWLLLHNVVQAQPAYRQIQEGTIINLYDAFGRDENLTQDFGFSCLLKFQGKNILFDAGSNADIFRSNVEQLGLDLRTVDIAIVSHGHFDHLNGMDYLLEVNPKVKIYMPYDLFWGAPAPFDATGQEPAVRDSLPPDMQYFNGGDTKFVIQQSGRFWHADVEYVKTSKEILPGVRLVATSSPFMGYFMCYPGKSFVPGQFDKAADTDYRYINLPELSLTLDNGDGQVVVVGCSHSGVENIVREAKNLTRDSIALVYGGFHLLPYDRGQLDRICSLLKNDLGVAKVAPAHCTGHLAFRMLKTLYGENYLFAGLGETVTFSKP